MHSKSFETGFIDHHHMIYTILKTTYSKLPSKKVIYRNYKKWSQLPFEDDMRRKLTLSHPSVNRINLCECTRDKCPTKTRIVRANDKPNVTEELRRAMTRRSRLKNIANKSNREEDIRKYKYQTNLVAKFNLHAKNSILCQYRQKQ